MANYVSSFPNGATVDEILSYVQSLRPYINHSSDGIHFTDADHNILFTFHPFGVMQCGVDSATPVTQQIKSADQINSGTGLGALFQIKPGESKGLNQKGQNLELWGGQGTGSGAGGKISFKVTPAGASGTANNNPVEAMSVYSNKYVGMGPWASNGDNVPLSLLHLLSNVAGTTPSITLENLSATLDDETRIDSILNAARAVTTRIGFRRVGSPQASDTEIYFSTGGVNTMSKRMTIKSVGNIGIGTDTPSDSAQLELSSTTRGFLPTRMTTAQRDAIADPVEGLQIYNLTTHKIDFYNGSAWETVTSEGV